MAFVWKSSGIGVSGTGCLAGSKLYSEQDWLCAFDISEGKLRCIVSFLVYIYLLLVLSELVNNLIIVTIAAYSLTA